MFISLVIFMMANSSKSYEFISAVRGFYVYRQEWQPQENEELICPHESDNLFDTFAIKSMIDVGKTTGHLPREISRPTKFLLDRGVKISATVMDTKYRRSTLFQGALEIRCPLRWNPPNKISFFKNEVNQPKFG